MRKRKILWLDSETTGTRPGIHGIHQISGLIEIDNRISREFNFHIRPFIDDVIEDEAIAISGVERKDFETDKYVAPHQAFRAINGIFNAFIDKYDRNDKFYPAGQNVLFDVSFLNVFFLKNGVTPWGVGSHIDKTRDIDLFRLVTVLERENIIQLESRSLSDVCKLLEIPLNAHDSLEDIKATRDAYNKLVNRYITR